MTHERSAPRRPSLLLLAVPMTLLLACGGGATSPGPAMRLEASGGYDPDVLQLIEQRANAVDAAPTEAKLRVSLALAYEANALGAKAEDCWDQALALDPDQATWLTHKGAALEKRGAIDEALATYQRALELEPTLGATLYRLGLLQLEMGEDELALASFQATIAQRPGAVSAHVAKGEALNNLEREEQAAAACEKALSLDPTYKRAHYVLGIAYRGMGRMEDAQRELALGADSETRFLSDSLSAEMNGYRRGYGARVQDAIDLVNAGKPAQAIPLLEKVLVSQPKDRVALVNLGVSYINVGKTDKAIEILLRALALDQNDFAVLINLATAELAMGRVPDALEHSDQAVKAAPNVSATYYMRSHVYMTQGRFGEAYADLKKASSLNTEDPRYWIEAGDCAARLGLNEDAVERYARGLKLQPTSLPALVSMGMLADQLGRRSVAEDAYRKAKALQPNHERVVALGQRLGLQ